MEFEFIEAQHGSFIGLGVFGDGGDGDAGCYLFGARGARLVSRAVHGDDAVGIAAAVHRIPVPILEAADEGIFGVGRMMIIPLNGSGFIPPRGCSGDTEAHHILDIGGPFDDVLLITGYGQGFPGFRRRLGVDAHLNFGDTAVARRIDGPDSHGVLTVGHFGHLEGGGCPSEGGIEVGDFIAGEARGGIGGCEGEPGRIGAPVIRIGAYREGFGCRGVHFIGCADRGGDVARLIPGLEYQGVEAFGE